MSLSAIESIELSIKESKELIHKGQALLRLMKNKDFQELITRGLLEQSAISLVHSKGLIENQDPLRQAAINRGIDAISSLKIYLDHTIYLHDQAIKDLEMNQQELEAIFQEGLNQ